MFPQPMPRSDFSTEGSHPDLTTTLEQHIHAGFQPDLALDLVLNELVVRAAEATGATSAALALARGEELVCRAATGNFAPDLGVPLNPREGLSGVCLRTRQPQLSVDAEVDPRVGASFSRRFSIRSVLVVPVFDVDKVHFMGVLEVFSPAPAAFSSADQYLLEAYADECARVRQAAFEFSQPKSVIEMPPPEPPKAVVQAYAKAAAAPSEFAVPISLPRILPAPELADPDPPSLEVPEHKPQAAELPASDVAAPEVRKADVLPPDFALLGGPPTGGSTYEAWTLFLGALAILAIVGVSFVIGSRIGWFRAAEVAPATVSPPSAANVPQSGPRQAGPTQAMPATSSASTEKVQAEAPPQRKAAQPKPTRSESRVVAEKPANSAAEGNDLVVYEKGKVVFRMKNGPGEPYPADQPNNSNSINPGAQSAAVTSAPGIPPNSAPAQSVWLNPADAQNRLVNRTEPQYPAAARASHRSGDVVLEIDVAEDGSISAIHTVKGDPLLAPAAIAAVRNWRYQPYLVHGRPSPFHTDVTLSFTYSN
jgi:TonB family protein